ncbi:HNH endonuclease [Streptomyces sp. NPDC087440]|uniref:HNH endonuclease signature motif containing protein n=1 Tax=Streptomyces sp. NPDC087440 TaxID=3365790 RepID=UPI0037FE07CB
MPELKYAPRLLAKAARESTSWHEAVKWFGHEPTVGARSYLRQKMKRAGVDTTHFENTGVRHTEARLRELVATSQTTKEVVRKLGISPVGGNQAHIGRRIAELGIDTSHFTQPRSGPKGARGPVLALGSPDQGRIPGERLRRNLLKLGISETCANCGTGPEWNGRPLRLEVDHMNGDWWDNRPENLQLLCPNCHAVTDTYRGRKRRFAA